MFLRDVKKALRALNVFSQAMAGYGRSRIEQRPYRCGTSDVELPCVICLLCEDDLANDVPLRRQQQSFFLPAAFCDARAPCGMYFCALALLFLPRSALLSPRTYHQYTYRYLRHLLHASYRLTHIKRRLPRPIGGGFGLTTNGWLQRSYAWSNKHVRPSLAAGREGGYGKYV